MVIWVDADACPAPIKEIVFRAAERVRVPTVLVANRPLRVPKSHFIKAVHVAAGFDVADAHILAGVGTATWSSRRMCRWPRRSSPPGRSR